MSLKCARRLATKNSIALLVLRPIRVGEQRVSIGSFNAFGKAFLNFGIVIDLTRGSAKAGDGAGAG